MRRLAIAVVVSCAILMAPTSLKDVVAATPSHEEQVVVLVNQIRAENGLAPLSPSPQLSQSAERYSSYMADAGFFGHVGPDGSTLVSRDEAAGFTDWVFLGENLAAGYSSPSSVVDGWMASPTHRANILSPKAKQIGVGYVSKPGSQFQNYWTQEFGSLATAR